MKDKDFSRKRYGRALQLRRAIIPHILHHDPKTGAVALTDALDDVLYGALAREAALERRKQQRARGAR